MMLRSSARPLLALALTTAAIGCDDNGVVAPLTPVPGDAPAVVTRLDGSTPVLEVGTLQATQRTRIHLSGVTDPIPGNPAGLIPTDANILALANPTLSPDGSRIAVVATAAFDQSEIVVVNKDGTGAQVASVNSQIIGSSAEWSPDGKKLVYTMSTLPGLGGVDVFTTDLTTHTVTRLTTNANLGNAVVRWSADGKSIYYARVIPGGPVASEVVRVDVATKTPQSVAANVSGRVVAIGRNGQLALVLRQSAMTGSQSLVLVNLSSAAEQTILSDGVAAARFPATTEDFVLVTMSETLNSPHYRVVYWPSSAVTNVSLVGNASFDAFLLSPALIN
jgi:Tol biopolymer transport system component